MVEKLFPDPFLKNQNRAYLRINILKFYLFCLYYLESRALSKLIETKLQTTCIYLIKKQKQKQKEVWKPKEVWNKSPCPIFCMVFEEKYFSCYIFLSDHISMSGCLYFVRYWKICVL